MAMQSIALPSSADRFSDLTRALCRVVADCLGRRAMELALILLVVQRLRLVEKRLLGLMARWKAGTLRTRIARVGVARAPISDERALRRVKPQGMNRQPGWLVHLAGHHAAGLALHLRHVLAEPDMVALLTEVPQAARILSPVCRMLGIERQYLKPVRAAELVPVERPERPEPAPPEPSTPSSPNPYTPSWLRLLGG